MENADQLCRIIHTVWIAGGAVSATIYLIILIAAFRAWFAEKIEKYKHVK